MTRRTYADLINEKIEKHEKHGYIVQDEVQPLLDEIDKCGASREQRDEMKRRVRALRVEPRPPSR